MYQNGPDARRHSQQPHLYPKVSHNPMDAVRQPLLVQSTGAVVEYKNNGETFM